MAVNVDLMRAYTDGAVYTHDPDTPGTITAPTNATTALAAGFLMVGAITSDGITESTSQDRTDIFIWQNNALARRLPGQYTKTWQFAAAETSLLTLGVQFPGSAITATAEGVSVAEKPPTADVRAWVIEGLDGTDRKVRIYLPKAEVTERGDFIMSAQDGSVYEWTLSAYVDGSGVVAYRYYDDPDMATP